MRLVEVTPDELIVSEDFRRSGRAKQFEERLQASIDEVGLAEPLKIAPMPSGGFLVVDGVLRLAAIQAIRTRDERRFARIPAYLTNFDSRFEIRYQTDIYQDLLPSQLAALVEHLHKAERVKKSDIARYIGVSPTTLRNYTGLWRLMSRGGLVARIVDLMDAGVIPSSNPYAWLRLTDEGVALVLLERFTGGRPAESWIDEQIAAARAGNGTNYITSFVEAATGGLDAQFYREEEDLRNVKRDLGLRRALNQSKSSASVRHAVSPAARNRLSAVSRKSPEPVLQNAARALRRYLV